MIFLNFAENNKLKMSHPKGLYLLFATEMWERFNEYKSILRSDILKPFIAAAVSSNKGISVEEAKAMLDEAENAVMEFARLPSIVTDVRINGKDAGKIMWTPYRLDLTGLANVGENEIQITLTGSLRNLLGPFHLEEGETYTALPFYFFRKSNIWGWGDGFNRKWTNDYSFVRNGLYFKETKE